MSDFNDEQFRDCWRKTEVIRQYERMLYTFGDMTLPYIFLAEHQAWPDRTLVRKGIVYIRKPNIVLPGRTPGPEFAEGFEHADFGHPRLVPQGPGDRPGDAPDRGLALEDLEPQDHLPRVDRAVARGHTERARRGA